MSQKLGINMINMYCDLITNEFAPIFSAIHEHANLFRSNTEIEAKKELGYFDLVQQKTKLQAQVHELDLMIASLTKKQHTKTGYFSRIDELVNSKLKKASNGVLQEATKIKSELLKSIKLSGVSDDVRTIFDNLEKTIQPLNKKIKALPKIKPVKLLKK